MILDIVTLGILTVAIAILGSFIEPPLAEPLVERFPIVRYEDLWR